MGVKEFWIKMKYPHWTSSSQRHNRKEEREDFKAIEMRAKSIPLSIQNLLNEFMVYRQENLEQIHHFQRKFYRF